MIVASTLGGKVLAPLVQLVAQWRLVVNARDAYQRLETLLSDFPLRESGMPLPAPRGLLTVEGVVAAAPNSHVPILKGVSFAIQPGECVMLIGPSAAGKTTLARLIMGLWPASAGKVRLDGADVYAWDKTELGPYLGYLPQTVELFAGTVAENVARFGDLDVVELERVIELVGLTSTISALPDGVNTYVGEDGAVLSGGQRQRVGIARALAMEPSFIVCDEAVSALDVSIQGQIINLLEDLQRELGVAYLFIAHDLAVVRHISMRVVVMYLGKVVEMAASKAVVSAPKHPYTQALLSAVPVVDPDSKRQRIVLPGDVPSPINPPSGCPFHPRCPVAEARCKTEVPALREVSAGHFAACHLAK